MRFWARAFCAGSALLQIAEACVQIDLVSVKNSNGVITDFMSQEDELSAWFGVGEQILFTWRQNM